MNMDQLRMMKTIVLAGSFAKASELLFVSQSTLSRQINTMEKELGFPLFVRSSTGIALTKPGQIFYEECPQILHLYDHAIRNALKESKENHYLLNVGIYDYSFNIITSCINMIKKALPEYEFNFIPCRTNESFKALQEKSIDLLLLSDYLQSNDVVTSFKTIESHNCCRIPTTHPLAKKKELTLEMLANETLLLHPKGTCANVDTLYKLIEEKAPNAHIITYDSPLEANALAISNNYIILTLGFFEDLGSFHNVMLKDAPLVPLGVSYLSEKEETIKPLLPLAKKYFETSTLILQRTHEKSRDLN